MDVTFVVNGIDLSEILSTYRVAQNVSYRKVITTLDETEHSYPGAIRTTIDVSFLPLSDEKASQIYNALKNLIVDVLFTDPHKNSDVSYKMRVTSNFETRFGLRSIDGNRYYRGGTIKFRQV